MEYKMSKRSPALIAAQRKYSQSKKGRTALQKKDEKIYLKKILSESYILQKRLERAKKRIKTLSAIFIRRSKEASQYLAQPLSYEELKHENLLKQFNLTDNSSLEEWERVVTILNRKLKILKRIGRINHLEYELRKEDFIRQKSYKKPETKEEKIWL